MYARLDFLVKNEYTNIAGSNTLYNRVTEFTFKCHVMAPVTMPPKGGFFC